MTVSYAWHEQFIEWVREDLKSILPSSRDLVDLLDKYAREQLKYEEPEDWIEENLEAVLKRIEQEGTLEAVYDREDNSAESVSIKLTEEGIPDIRNMEEGRSKKDLTPPSNVLEFQLVALKEKIESLEPVLRNLKDDIGRRDNSNITLFELCRKHESQIQKFIEDKNTYKAEMQAVKSTIENLRYDIGDRNNSEQNLFEWIRSREQYFLNQEKIAVVVDKIKKNLEFHIGAKEDFEFESETFENHFQQIILACFKDIGKEKGLLLTLLGILAASIFGIWQISSRNTEYRTNLKNTIDNIETRMNQLEVEVEKIQDSMIQMSTDVRQPPPNNIERVEPNNIEGVEPSDSRNNSEP